MSKNKLIKFKDSIVIERNLPSNLVTDAKTILNADKRPSLKVEIEATHSGVLINRRVYPGRHVKDGYRSLISKERGGTSEYDKPILKHHDSHSDPIGRIVGAKYQQIKFGDQFDHDFLMPDKNGSKGSGAVYIDALISDSDSIEKIIDTRYLSVSAGHHSPYFLCSTCGDSLYDCEHLPGLTYNEEGERDDNGAECYGITGPMFYDEVSFVNMPASPPAKLLNFEWSDNKSDWSKDSITTFVNRKKEAVRTFALCDESGELDLLTSKFTPTVQKTVVAVSPAIADKLMHVMSSDKPDPADEATNVRQPANGDSSGVLNDGQNLDKANHLETHKEDNEMDAEKLAELETELASLKDKLTAAQTTIKELKEQVEAKDGSIERLKTDAEAMQKKMSQSLAWSLGSLRTRFNKVTPGTDEKDFDLNAYVEKLAERSVDSLQDSLQDLMAEINQLPKTSVEVEKKTALDMVKGDKVTDPTLKNDDKKVVKKTGKKTSADLLDKEFGL